MSNLNLVAVFEQQIAEWDNRSALEQTEILEKVNDYFNLTFFKLSAKPEWKCSYDNAIFCVVNANASEMEVDGRTSAKILQKKAQRKLGVYVPLNLLQWIISKRVKTDTCGFNPNLEFSTLICK